MSEQILKALMHLFALVSSPESDRTVRRRIVEDFLRKQLNQELAQEYVKIFDMFFAQYHDVYRDKQKIRKHISSSSVRVLSICEQINRELEQPQKFLLIVMLLSFIKSGVDENVNVIIPEQDFVETIASSFNIESDEYTKIQQFVTPAMGAIIESPDVLYINNKSDAGAICKHLFREGIIGNIAVLHIASVNMYICRYEGLSELHLNGQLMKIDEIYVLNYGCSIRSRHIHSIYYSNIVNCFYRGEQDEPILFEAKHLEYAFDSGHIGLQSLSFSVFSGNIVGIMGGSGSGKSTMLSVLTGLYKPAWGNVLINNIDIHHQQKEIEGIVGLVSQDDLLLEELTVFQNLYFNAKLCFGQQEDEQIRQKTEHVLRELGLFEIRNMKVGSPLNKKISGGQRKRLNIALELIREPSVLFLDEPTSGLSSHDSENILDLLKGLSLKGKLVFVVIHQPSSDIFKMLDKLIVLDKGGYMIYNGDPVDSITYFKSQTNQANRDISECPECGNVNPEQIFNIVEAHVLNEHGQPTLIRRKSPIEWYEAFDQYSEPEIPDSDRPVNPPCTKNIKRPSRLQQFFIYSSRNILSKVSDMQYIAICLLEAPVLALLLSYIIRYYNVSDEKYTFGLNENVPIYIFVAVIIAIFIGLSVSAEEIIKDRKIIKRERFLNLSRASYLSSKTLVLFAISAIQAFLFVIIGNSVIGVVQQTFAYWVVLFSAWTCANLMGLIISDTFKSVVTIYIFIPFIVIPQLMLSGVLLHFEKINPDIATPASVPWYGEIITARWAFEAIAVEQFINNDYERALYPYEKQMSVADFKKNYWVVEMKNKLNELKTTTNDNDAQQTILSLIANEIDIENTRQEQIRFPFKEKIIEGLSPMVLDETAEYLDKMSRYYTAVYNKTSEQKDKKMMEYLSDSLQALKTLHYNRSLADMVKNTNETYRIIEYKDRFLQNYHQIYKDPEYPFIKAHFYAPEKNIFGKSFPTIWVNVIVMWCFNVFFFIALYFRWLPRSLEVFEKIKKKLNNN